MCLQSEVKPRVSSIVCWIQASPYQRNHLGINMTLFLSNSAAYQTLSKLCFVLCCLITWMLLLHWASSTFSPCLTIPSMSQVWVFVWKWAFPLHWIYMKSYCFGWWSSTFSMESHAAFWLLLRPFELNYLRVDFVMGNKEWTRKDSCYPNFVYLDIFRS